MSLGDNTYMIEKGKISRDIKEMRRELVWLEETKYEFMREIELT